MNVGSLFAGIGGFDLGFERAGLQTLWFCEQNPYRQRVLARHWPGVPIHSDVCALVADSECRRLVGAADDQREHALSGANGRKSPMVERLADEGRGERSLPVPVPYVDVLCGGFPCQDISLAGRGAGIEGSRSGLWGEFARLIGELRPRYVVAENVPALTSRGLDRVLADLAACGFDAEWDHLPAAAFGAPHRRDRIWIVAYPAGTGLEGLGADPGCPQESESRNGGALADAEAVGKQSRQGEPEGEGPRRGRPLVGTESGAGGRIERGNPSEGGGVPGRDRLTGGASSLAHPPRDAQAGPVPQAGAERKRIGAGGERGGTLPDADPERGNGTGTLDQGREEPANGDLRGFSEWWRSEPDVGRVAHGVSNRVDRLAALGDSLVPQIAEWIGRRIVEWES